MNNDTLLYQCEQWFENGYLGSTLGDNEIVFTSEMLLKVNIDQFQIPV